MAEVLKPCPFCGGEAAIQRFSSQCLPFRIICSCGAEIRGGKGESVADGIERWNRRTERTCRKVPGRMKYGRRMPKCSKCGQSLGDERWSYCPSCGARVVGEDS